MLPQLTIMKLELDKFDPKDETHQKIAKFYFNVSDLEKFKNTSAPYFVMDGYGNTMKLEENEMDIDMYKRFLIGPKQFKEENDIFEYLDAKSKANIHYFVIYNGMRKFGQK